MTFVVRRNGNFIRHTENLLEAIAAVPNFMIDPYLPIGDGWSISVEPQFETPEEREVWRKNMVRS